MPIGNNPVYYFSPITYYVDIMNVGLGATSIFGSFGVLIDLAILIAFGIVFLIISFFFHQKTLEKRFKG
jgi:hypothetical protein